MRVLIAPDKFAGTLTAVEAAAAIEAGWRRRDPDAEVYIAPMADGGPGFLDVLGTVVDGSLLSVTVRGPLGDPVPATVLLAGETAYVESAQACGLHLVEPDDRRPEDATTYGVGELVAAAVEAGARRVIIGLGGSGTNDGGAGLLAALGATAEPAGALEAGATALAELTGVELAPARERLAGVTLVAATDVENPLLGLRGATSVFGPQKGIAGRAEAGRGRLADPARRRRGPQGGGREGRRCRRGPRVRVAAAGAERVSGIDLVAELTGLRQAAGKVDLVLTGEGAFDFQSRDGKVVAGVAKVANDAMRPCVVLAGKVLIGAREMRTMGIESAYALVDSVGEERAFADPQGSLATVAERVARSWVR